VGGRVDSPGQPADHRQPGPRQSSRKAFRHLPAVVRAAAGSDHRHSQLIARLQGAAAIKDGRGIGYLRQRPRVVRAAAKYELNSQIAAAGQFRFRLVRHARRDNGRRQLRADSFDLPELGVPRLKHRLGRGESLQQSLLGPRADAGDQVQPQGGEMRPIIGDGRRVVEIESHGRFFPTNGRPMRNASLRRYGL
jgi:hypothetical protein